MHVNLSKLVEPSQKIAVAVSGGCDSMALLHYLLSVSNEFNIEIIALNVEHGIRGDESIADSTFVKEYCDKLNVPVLTYFVDSIKCAREQKLSIEQSARKLRYECFFDAINSKKCDKVATAHHLDDNVESILFNLFRGTGVKGASGITDNYDNKIIRPFLSTPKSEIVQYAKENNLPFVTDSTNFCTDYTRNALRLDVIPRINKIFPKAQNSIARFAEILNKDDDYMQSESLKAVTIFNDKAEILLPVHPAIFARATVIALKSLGIEKDYEKVHVDDAYSLVNKPNGTSIDLPQNVVAIKEYDKIVFYIKQQTLPLAISFKTGKFNIGDKIICIEKLTSAPKNLKDGFYLDADKIPKTATIRYREEGDSFTKFGGGTKSLGDYLTDKKIPIRERDALPIIANEKEVLAIFGIAISDKVKVNDTTKTIFQITIDD